MATPSELDIINSNPIKNGLSNFRRLFESARADLGVADSSDAVQAVFSTATIGTAQLPMATIFTNILKLLKACCLILSSPYKLNRLLVPYLLA